MSSADITLSLLNTARQVSATGARRVLRIALYPGELLRIPHARNMLHVLAGTAWISGAGRDFVAAPGTSVELPRSREPALVSGLGSQPLLFEVW